MEFAKAEGIELRDEQLETISGGDVPCDDFSDRENREKIQCAVRFW